MVANLLGFINLTQNTNFSRYRMQIGTSLFGVASDTIFLKCYDLVCPTHGVCGQPTKYTQVPMICKAIHVVGIPHTHITQQYLRIFTHICRTSTINT